MESLILAASVAEPTLLETICSWAWMILSVGAGLGFVIFVHELGHFLVAKACGVKCEKFYVGFDFFELRLGPIVIPRALCKFHYGETEYGIGIMPLGGYVKMLGQDDDPRNAEKEAARIKAGQPESSSEGITAAQVARWPADPASEKVQLDPRSLPAKSIPARAAIFAAGVVMNLIFGVILGAAAYKIGVMEMPAIIGSTSPGGPAWQENIQPGSKVVQLGTGAAYEHFRWEDLMREAVLAGSNGRVAFTVRTPDGQRVDYGIITTDRLKAVTGRPTIGIVPQMSREMRLAPESAVHLGATVSPALEEKDVLVAIDGQRLEANYEVNELLAKRPSGPLKIVVARKPKPVEGSTAPVGEAKEMELVVEPKPMRDVGLVMRAGPIVAVQEGSPAQAAGFRVGDVLEQVNGEPIGDPLSLGQRLAPASEPAEEVTFTVKRPGAGGKPATETISVTPILARQFHESFPVGGPTAIESIGVAFGVTNVVDSVLPDSPAAKAGLKPGDTIIQADLLTASEADKKAMAAYLGEDAFEPTKIDDGLKSWTYVFHLMQVTPPGTQFKLTYNRGGKVQSADLEAAPSQAFFDESRGLNYYAVLEKNQAKDWAGAFSLGFRETKERLVEVLRVLASLLTGKLSPTMLSGPLGIIAAAGSFANDGISRLLIFLTILSANLVVLNLLPIPALDGGHLLFLAAEAVRGKPVDEKLQMRLTIAGVICLLGLMVFATLMDLDRFFL